MSGFVRKLTYSKTTQLFLMVMVTENISDRSVVDNFKQGVFCYTLFNYSRKHIFELYHVTETNFEAKIRPQ